MATLDTYRKRAKPLLGWHRDGDPSIGGRVRGLPRFASLTDRDVLAMPLPLALAQEIVAVEAGFPDWAALKTASADRPKTPCAEPGEPTIHGAVPILFVRDVAAAAEFYVAKLGFARDFLHGAPPFYGSVSRGQATLHLRHVGAPNFTALAAREASLILATIPVTGVKPLFHALAERGVDLPQPLTTHPWGGTDFHVRDPDGNVISFVEHR